MFYLLTVNATNIVNEVITLINSSIPFALLIKVSVDISYAIFF